VDVDLAQVDQLLDEPAQPEFLQVNGGFAVGLRRFRGHALFSSEPLRDSSTSIRSAFAHGAGSVFAMPCHAA
jgi:hypothetical protein